MAVVKLWENEFAHHQQVTLSTGEILHDTCVWPNFVQDELGINISEVWDSCLQRPTYPIDQPLEKTDGWNPEWVRGGHRALRMRGNAIGRHKIWLQTEYANGLRRYGYTGWQWKISFAKHRIEAMPKVQELVLAINKGLSKDHNDWIITKYESEKNSIGFHHDKVRDLEEDTGFVVIKTGAPRFFQFKDNEGRIVFSKKLTAGTAIFVGSEANKKVLHAVPRMKTRVGMSGSIVGRRIKTIIDWKRVEKEVAKRA